MLRCYWCHFLSFFFQDQKCICRSRYCSDKKTFCSIKYLFISILITQKQPVFDHLKQHVILWYSKLKSCYSVTWRSRPGDLSTRLQVISGSFGSRSAGPNPRPTTEPSRRACRVGPEGAFGYPKSDHRVTRDSAVSDFGRDRQVTKWRLRTC